jgi:hypothetical protein
MWQLELAAVWAFLELLGGQRVMAAAHIALGRRGFSLRDGHEAPIRLAKKLATISRLLNGKPRGGGRIVANRRPYSET